MQWSSVFPDYRRLSQTPSSQTESTLTEQVRMGSGRKTLSLAGHQPAVPYAQSDRKPLPLSPDRASPSTRTPARPLHVPETPTQYPFASARQVTSKSHTPRAFRNRADHPYTDRQQVRAMTRMLEPKGQCDLGDLVKKSVEVGQKILASLASAQQQPPKHSKAKKATKPAASSETPAHTQEMSLGSMSEIEEKEFYTTEAISETKADQAELETYSTLSKEEQRQMLKRLRSKYDSRKNAGIQIIAKDIQAYLDTLT